MSPVGVRQVILVAAGPLDEDPPAVDVGRPAQPVLRAELDVRPDGRVLAQQHGPGMEAQARVAQFGVGPQVQRAVRQQVVRSVRPGRREGQQRSAAGGQLGDRPGGQFDGPQAGAAQAVQDFGVGLAGDQADLHLLLDAGARLRGLDQAQRPACFLHLHGPVIRDVGARNGFGRMPQAVTAVEAVLLAAAFPQILRVQVQLVLAARQPEMQDARADGDDRNQFHQVVGQPEGLPAVKVDAFHGGLGAKNGRVFSR